MVDDTFLYNVANPASAGFLDILSGEIRDVSGTPTLALIEGSSVNFDYDNVIFTMTVKNTGETVKSGAMKLFIGAVEQESEVITDLAPGASITVGFDKGGAGYAIPNGGSVDFQVKSE